MDTMSAEHEAEIRTAGSIPGVSSNAQEKTYPTIVIRGGIPGEIATIIASLVTVDEYRPHPHSLVGRNCDSGIFVWRELITSENHVFQFQNLGIKCSKMSEVRQELKKRQKLHLQLQVKQLGVDPYRKGFSHANQHKTIDLKAVRLAFQVFLNRPDGQVVITADPTDIIHDSKSMPSNLKICHLSHCSGPVHGDTAMILLCEKINSDHVSVIFYEKDASDQVVWEAYAKIESVHKQVALVMRTPPYEGPQLNRQTRDAIRVRICLYNSVDNNCSEHRDFHFIPHNDSTKRKCAMPELLDYNSQSSRSRRNSSQPGTSERQSLQHVPSEHQSSQPGPSQCQSSEPGPFQRQSSQPGPSQCQSSEPGPSQRQSSQPGPSLRQFSQPGPFQRQFSEPGSSQSQSSQPEPSQRSTLQFGPSKRQSSQPEPPQRQSLRGNHPQLCERHQPAGVWEGLLFKGPDFPTEEWCDEVKADELLTHNASIEPVIPIILTPSRIDQLKERCDEVEADELLTHSASIEPTEPILLTPLRINQSQEPLPSISTLLQRRSCQHQSGSAPSSSAETSRRESYDYCDDAIELRTSPFDKLLESLRSNAAQKTVSSHGHGNQEPHDETNTPESSLGSPPISIPDECFDSDFEF